jgi:release factor glutamine methyltransferase
VAERPTLGTLKSAVAERLAVASESPGLDAELLICRAIDVPRAYLYAHPEDEPDDNALERLEAAVARRLAGEPMAYITGSREFWSLPLAVSPATLVPRPETERLVELALGVMPRRAASAVLDLGTGSGAIACAIARERPASTVVGVDISSGALDVAALNARELRIPNVEWLHGDWTAPVAGRRFDVVVSNPPYVASDDEALASLAHEPVAALAAGADGLDAIRRLAAEVPGVITAGGTLLIEHGATQASAVEALLVASGWTHIASHTDYAGLPRVCVARWPAPDGNRGYTEAPEHGQDTET